MTRKPSRREVLKATAGALVGAPLLRSSLWAAEPKEIKIGFTLSQAGPYAVPAQHSQMTNYVMWSEEVNARGGIFVKKLGKRLPVRLIHYDDRSHIGTGVRLYEKLATQDKVDLMLPPWGTAMNFAVAPIAQRYKYPMIGVTVTSEKLKTLKMRYFLTIIQQSDVMSQALADFLVSIKEEANLKTVGMLYVGDLFGIEFKGASAPLLPKKGFDILTLKSYPLGTKDLSATLKRLKARNVDIYIGHSYPPDGFLATAQAQAAGFSPKVFYTGVAAIFPAYWGKFGASVNGVIGPGVWNHKVPFGDSKAYFDRFVKRWKRKPDAWGGPCAWAMLQVLEQAIEKVGDIDREKLTDAFHTEKFSTILGPVKFTNGLNLETPGMVQQWQNGVYEIVWPRDRATARPIAIKPAWK
ncbi:MAG: amino acid ABC transporter substrate-binding protein [Nitrospinota bacterium]